MPFRITLSKTADSELTELENNPALKKRFKSVAKALAFLETNPRHPSLCTHEFTSKTGENGEKVFEAYAEKTPHRLIEYFGIMARAKVKSR
ncbi:MAG: hypothetical protein FD163_646 [Hyphomonadaceae bacterium]|nr:MAG: hypothetical protein FD128_1173 [Hyphomonadaceae bacterium]KAF0185978.1 MAG: hypothetical protein FD163_646 [Hyphomonadaceae bacterium]